ncbi:hypothetical protein [Pseudomonas aeruginosa]|uniref:hypothetical protein n=1 Tax=Pseudomonas aeruginosa TaxID=287 RepID=UPI00265B91BD|nr:hypothetical protein [Pseudomonas aeruginosa]MDO1429101.1 hypothetical protein [Pseudomonas aeruginosa]
MLERDRQMLSKIEPIARIDSNESGWCEETGTRSRRRLRQRPTATLCVYALSAQEPHAAPARKTMRTSSPAEDLDPSDSW